MRNDSTNWYDGVSNNYQQQTSIFQIGEDFIRLNGTTYSNTNALSNPTGDASDTPRTGQIILGNYSQANNAFIGYIAEHILIDGAISDADRDKIETNQMSYFGII